MVIPCKKEPGMIIYFFLNFFMLIQLSRNYALYLYSQFFGLIKLPFSILFSPGIKTCWRMAGQAIKYMQHKQLVIGYGCFTLRRG